MAQLLWRPRLPCFLLSHWGFLPRTCTWNQETPSCVLGSLGMGVQTRVQKAGAGGFLLDLAYE